MDKETLSNYGWIVICVMVLAVMLALASPFGQFVAGAIQSTTQGLFDVNQNALDSAGIEIMEQEFEEMLNGPSATNSPVKFGQPYQITMDGMVMEYVFYADGSATMWMADAMAEYMPAGTFTYTATEVTMGEDPLSISPDGTYLYDPEDETFRMTVKSVSKGSLKTNTAYVADPNGLVGVTGVDIQVGTDGSITIYQNGVAGETIPASSIQWYENYYTIDGEIAGVIYPDGSRITIEGIVCVAEKPVVCPIQYGKPYVTPVAASYMSFVFYEDGSMKFFGGGTLEKAVEANSIRYAGRKIYVDNLDDFMFPGTTIFEVSEDGTQLTISGNEDIVFNFQDIVNSGISNSNRYFAGYSDSIEHYAIPETFVAEDGQLCTITGLNVSAFEDCLNLKSIEIPVTVTGLGQWAFNHCGNLSSIIYHGTMEQWNAIEKRTYWNQGVPATYVQCSDGQVSLK